MCCGVQELKSHILGLFAASMLQVGVFMPTEKRMQFVHPISMAEQALS